MKLIRIENAVSINGKRFASTVNVVQCKNGKYTVYINGVKQPYECIDYSTAVFFGMGIDAAYNEITNQVHCN